MKFIFGFICSTNNTHIQTTVRTSVIVLFIMVKTRNRPYVYYQNEELMYLYNVYTTV